MNRRILWLFPVLALALLAGCNFPPKPLTEDELDQCNEAFQPMVVEDGVGDSTEISCFFTSFYNSPEELDLEAFLAYFPGSLSETVTDEDTEEFAALMALMGDGLTAQKPSDLPWPTHRIPREVVDRVLSEHAGITTADLKDTGGVLYLEEYDAFYNFTSDFGPGAFVCEDVERANDSVRLWSAPLYVPGTDETAGRAVLILQKAGDTWFIQSFQLLDGEIN